MRAFGLLSACAALVGGVGAAQAQPPPQQQPQPPPQQQPRTIGFYLQGTLHAGFSQSVHFTEPGISGELKYHEPGWGGSGALGYKIGNGFRIEFEVGYAEYDLKDITGNGVTRSLSGTNKVLSFTGNAYYDFRIWPGINPYIGGGMGMAHVDRGSVSLTAGGATATVGVNNKNDFTAVFETGLNIELTRNIELVPAYRFQWVEDGSKGVGDDQIHQARLGLRYTF